MEPDDFLEAMTTCATTLRDGGTEAEGSESGKLVRCEPSNEPWQST